MELSITAGAPQEGGDSRPPLTGSPLKGCCASVCAVRIVLVSGCKGDGTKAAPLKDKGGRHPPSVNHTHTKRRKEITLAEGRRGLIREKEVEIASVDEMHAAVIELKCF